MSIDFILYSRPDCHLCTEMVNQLKKIGQLDGHQLKIVDINTDQDLVARYGSRIPILIANGTILCQFQLDRDAVINYIAQACD